MRTLIAGGGTGGHLTPAMAVASLLRRRPGDDVLLVGRRGGLEERIVGAAGLPLQTVAISGVDSSRPLTAAVALARLPLAVRAADRIVASFRPDVVVGTAGYVCVPVVLAARRRRIPVVLLEQNARPGRAVRLLARGADAVAASYAETAARLPRTRVVHTGNPVRPDVLAELPAPLPDAPVHLLVMGGSQGARRLNMALASALRALLDEHPTLRVTHACGAHDAPWLLPLHDGLPAGIRSRHVSAAFFDDLATRIASSDLVLMRAGGSSLAEVSVLGRPMILVPYPHAGAHQSENAAPYVDAGAAVTVADGDLDGVRLLDTVGSILADPARWRDMAAASRSMGRPDAAERVVALIAEAADAHRTRNAA